VIGIALLIFNASTARSAAPINPSHFSIQTWSGVNGMPEESILGIAETSDGQIWLATRDGLTRFDGQSFHSIQPGVRDKSFGAAIAFQNSLWIGARDYLAVSLADVFQSHLNPQFEIHPFPRRDGDVFGIIGLYRRANGILWLHRADGVYAFDPADLKPPVLTYSPPPGEVVAAFHEGFDGRVWISTDTGVKQWSGSKWLPVAGAPTEAIQILLARDKTLWLYGRQGLFQLTGDKAKRFYLPSMNAIEPTRGLIEDRDGAIWAGILSGVVRVQNGALSVFNASDKIRSDDLIQVLTQTRDGAIWGGSKWGSLVRLSSPEFNNVDHRDGLIDSSTTSVVEDQSGHVWIGSRTSGIFYVEDGQKLAHVPGTGGTIIYAMAALSNQMLVYLDTLGLHASTRSATKLLYPAKLQTPGLYRALSLPYRDHIYVGDSTQLLKMRLPLGCVGSA